MGTTRPWFTRTAADKWQRIRGTAAGKRTAVIASVVLGAVVLMTGGAMATKAASNQFASATIGKLGGGDPQVVLDKIADRVVKQLLSKNGPIGEASASLTDEIGKAAGDKLAGIDTDSLLDDVSAEVVQAGMGKLNEISTDSIVDEVTSALIAQAMAKIDGLDLQALASSTLDGAVDKLLASVDLEKLIKEEIAKIDVEKVVTEVVQKQMGSSSGGLLGMLFQR